MAIITGTSPSVVLQLLLLTTAAALMLQQLPVSMATNFVVGDILGWGIPRTPSFYHDWAMSTLPNGFHTGDSLGTKILTPTTSNMLQFLNAHSSTSSSII
jgi:hypothetical protein